MADCGLNCDISDCMFCLGMKIENSIFYEIQQLQEGEIDEEWYDDKLDTFRHQELDYIISGMLDEACERIIYKYGIHEALKEYVESYGSIEIGQVNFCKTLLYNIVNDELCVKLSDYQGWCENHPLEDDDEEDDTK